MEYKHGYGPEMITGLAKIDGLLVGVVANYQGMLMNYPEYKMATYGQAMGVGGKLYRQGLIKMNEFVTLCARDRIPMLWVQDTTGIDVGNDAERAELLGLGQSLIYSIQSSKLPRMEITLRKAPPRQHYVLGRARRATTTTPSPSAPLPPRSTSCTARPLRPPMYARRLVKEEKAGEDLQPTIDKMNALIQDYAKKSSPKFCAKAGMTDEIVDMNDIRPYIQAFANACYQNPESICPVHQMLLPRVIRDYDALNAQ